MSTTMMQSSGYVLKTNTFGERYIYNLTRGLFDKTGSAVLYDKYLKKHLFHQDTLYVIVGTDSGLLPNYINQHDIPDGTRYLFIETEKALAAIFQHQLLDTLHPSIIVASEHDYLASAEYLKITEYLFINAVKHMPSLNAQQLSHDSYEGVKWQVQEWLDDLHWKNQASISGNRHFITKQLENCADNHIPVSTLKNQFQNQSVIILAGGPSLIDALPWVKANRDRLIVFAVARISKQLLNYDLTPDFLFSVDPFDISFNMCCDAFQFSPAPILIHSNHVAPKLLSQWHGQTLYLSARLPWKSELNVDNIYGAGPSVTNSALSVAELFGFDQILLSGVDLCFTKQGITHVTGSREAEAGPKYNTTSLQVETYQGDFHPTSVDFHSALTNLSTQAKAIRLKGIDIINISCNAARAKGIVYRAPNEILLPKRALNINQLRKDKLSEHDQNNQLKKTLSSLEKTLKDAYEQMVEIETLLEEALEVNEKLFEENTHKINKHQKSTLDAIEDKLNQEHHTFSTLIKTFSMKSLLKINKPHDNDRLLEQSELTRLGRVYYQAYIKGSNALKNLLTDALQRTKARLCELDYKPDFQLLIKQWRQDESYRRGTLLTIRRGDIPSAYNDEFEELDQLFKTQCEQAEKQNIERVSSMLGNIKAVPTKAKQLFRQMKVTELQDLLNSLQKDERNKHHIDHQALIKGYIAELTKNREEALQQYNCIVDHEQTPLLEEALNRIVDNSIHLEDYANAQLALKCLTQISPIYLPAFAESLRLSGQFLDAVDAYNLYLEQFPDDVETKIKLCYLYIHHDVKDAAVMMLTDIINKHPHHQSAQKILETL